MNDLARRSAWHAVARVFADEAVRVVTGVPGDDMHAVRAMHDAGVATEWFREQRTAVNVAAGFALTAHTPGVCIVGRGPGVMAAVPAVAEAGSGGVAIVLLSGGVPIGCEGAGAFQDLPQQRVLRPLVVATTRVTSPERVAGEVARALALARHRGMPVHVEIPDEMFLDEGAPTVWSRFVGAVDEAVIDAIALAQRPLILVGGGCSGLSADDIDDFARAVGAATMATASGRGLVNESADSYLGVAGIYLDGDAADVVAEGDLLICLGSRLEETASFGIADELVTVQVNNDPSGFSPARPGWCITADVRETLAAWLRIARHRDLRSSSSAVPGAARGRRRRQSSTGGVSTVLAAIAESLPCDAIVVHENGLADMWSYDLATFPLPPGVHDIAPSEQTTLGFGAAASIGAALACPDRAVVAIVGDGAMMTLAADRDQVRRAGRRILWLVLDNGGFGWLHSAADPVHAEQFARGSGHDLIADVFGVEIVRRARPDHSVPDVQDALRHALAGTPTVIVVPAALDDAPPPVARLAASAQPRTEVPA